MGQLYPLNRVFSIKIPHYYWLITPFLGYRAVWRVGREENGWCESWENRVIKLKLPYLIHSLPYSQHPVFGKGKWQGSGSVMVKGPTQKRKKTTAEQTDWGGGKCCDFASLPRSQKSNSRTWNPTQNGLGNVLSTHKNWTDKKWFIFI